MPADRSGLSMFFIRLIENWRDVLGNKLFTRAVLMDLSKAFDCIPDDLLIAKLHAYGLDFDAVTFISSYLKHRKQSVKISNISSFFQNFTFGFYTGLKTRSNLIQISVQTLPKIRTR